MTLSYLALALAIVLLLAGIAGTVFTCRTIVQRHAEHSPKTQMWHGISTPVRTFQFAELMIESERRHEGFSRLLYRAAYYVTLGVAAIEKMTASFIQLFSK